MKGKAWICRSEYFAVLCSVQVDSHFRGLHSSVPVITHPFPPQHSSWAGALSSHIDRDLKKKKIEVQTITCCCWCLQSFMCYFFFFFFTLVSYFEMVKGWFEPDLPLPFLRQFVSCLVINYSAGCNSGAANVQLDLSTAECILQWFSYIKSVLLTCRSHLSNPECPPPTMWPYVLKCK